MTISILKTWVPSSAEWDEAWRHCPYSTYFHSREWAETWADYRYGKIIPAPLGVALSDGTQIVLPFSKEKVFKGITNRYISSPAGTFGGWLSERSLDVFQQVVLIKFIAKHYPDLIWRFNPYEEVLYTQRIGHIVEDQTHVIDVSIGFEKLCSYRINGRSSALRKASKARKAGVEIILAESVEDWKKYYRIYEDSLHRWGEDTRITYSWHLFETIFRRTSPNIRLWLAKYDGMMIAGALCFYSPTHAVYWHGAALSSHFELRPVNLLVYEIIRDVADRGFKWFDFNPSAGLKGVIAFKRSFFATSLESNVLILKSARQRLFSFITAKIMSKLNEVSK